MGRRAEDRHRAKILDPDVNFHTLRHTFASHDVMRGGSLVKLQAILGHAEAGGFQRTVSAWRFDGARRVAGGELTVRYFALRRRTQVVKGADCKSVMRRFESARRLHHSRRVRRRAAGSRFAA